MTFKVVLKGFDTKEQARKWIDWYSGQGEQDDYMSIWMGDHISSVLTSGQTVELDDGFEQDVTVYYGDEDDD